MSANKIPANQTISNNNTSVFRKNPGELVVSEGQRGIDERMIQTRKIVQIVSHPEYDDFANRNDLAVLALVSPFSRSNVLNTICIPSIEETAGLRKCFATGWGDDNGAFISRID